MKLKIGMINLFFKLNLKILIGAAWHKHEQGTTKN